MVSRHRIAAIAVGLSLALTLQQHASAAPATGGVRIRGIDVTDYPQVTVTASVTDGTVTAADVRVTEDGADVSDVQVDPLQETGRGVDVVLAIDTSDSMAGEPLGAAIAAALKFVTALPTDQDIRVGIVTFAAHPVVTQGLTTDTAEVLHALGSLKTSPGTALYDAVGTASRMFDGSGQHNIVVLSDGGDRSSTGSIAVAENAANAASAAVFPIGLSSPDTDVRALTALARATGGEYAPAKTADLSRVYETLASRLSHQFLVTYHSTRKEGGQVEVALGVGSVGTDSAVVLEPKIQPPPPPPSAAPEPSKPLLGGRTGLSVALGLSFVAIFVLLLMMFGARFRVRRDRDLVRRMAAKQETGSTTAPEREHALAAWIPEPVVQAGARMAQAAGVGPRLEVMLERGGIPLRPGEFVAGLGLAAIVGLVIGGVLLHNPIFMLMIAAPAVALPIVYVRMKVRKRSQKLHGQLADILMILASSLRAGHGFFQALDLVAKEIGEPGAQEFGRVVAEVRLGRPVDEALNHMAERVGSDDFKWAVLGVNIQREVGGNLAEILDTIADTVRERDAVRRQVHVLSSEGRLSIGILAALPFLVSLYIAKVNPGYLNLLFSTRVGLIMVVTAISLLCVGILWMKKIVKIDV
ncbi:MAG: type II secretion system F family protein [Actinomycetota bacterium]